MTTKGNLDETLCVCPSSFFRILFLVFPSLALAQTSNAQRRITQAVDEKNLVVLKGNTHPMARQAFDRGSAPGSLPMNRMLLVLRHAPDRKQPSRTFSPSSRMNPRHAPPVADSQQYGETFGPSDADLQAVTSWLGSHGFAVARVANGRHVIESPGTAAQVQQAFTSPSSFSSCRKGSLANPPTRKSPRPRQCRGWRKTLHNFTPKATTHFPDNSAASKTLARP